MKLLYAFLLCLGMAAPAAAQSKSEPLAVVDGAAITAEEVEKPIAGQLGKLEEQIYNLKRQRLDALIAEKLLAKEAAKRRVTVAALLDAEVTSKVGLVTEQEIDAAYKKGQVTGDEAQAREQIRGRLQSQKLQAQREAFLASLRAQAKVVVHLKAPPVARVDVGSAGAATRGNPNAPVTIVEFSDFHCPFCKRVLATLAQLEAKYSGKVKLVFRDFPIDRLHPGARKGHEAARCAAEQGKFWPYHDKLFENAPKAGPDQLKAYAKEVGLDLDAFDKCVAGGKYQAAVQKDIDEGTAAGVTGTPAFFINGRLLSGAMPLEAFAKVIDDELERVGKK